MQSDSFVYLPVGDESFIEPVTLDSFSAKLPSTISSCHDMIRSLQQKIREQKEELERASLSSNFTPLPPTPSSTSTSTSTSIPPSSSTPLSAASRNLSVADELAQPIYKSVVKRLPWLIILLIVQSFSATIMNSFDTLIDSNIILSFFVPMLTGTGGNAGNQPSVMLTRALGMPGEKPIFKIFLKEMFISIIVSGILGLVTFGRILAEYPDQMTAAIAIAVALSLTVILSVFFGVMFSIIIDGFHNCDPADGAAPLVTTICDLLGILLLCGISSELLPTTSN